ncbi:MAG: AAA family ATPase [Sulfuritalea sp.]|nr:AAA family ATPase [Sulfuritalea sp.]
MSNTPKVYVYKTLERLVKRLRDDLNDKDFVLLYAYNGTGKTRLSMAFKEAGKKKIGSERDTLYFNAYTEDLFTWDNDLPGDSRRVLRFNSTSRFFDAFKELEMESRIRPYLRNYADFEFDLDYEKSEVSFSRGENTHIKVSRGEENIFIWCVFLALAESAIDGAQAYDWVKYIYIDDPISSLDDNNAIAVASDLAKLLRRGKDRVKTVVSSHHGLFFNVMYNELKTQQTKTYFLHKAKDGEGHTLRATTDTPFFHHVAMLSELQTASQTGALYTHHFNMLRSILEKTATFFGYKDFSDCLGTAGDEGLHARALNLLSHGKYSLYEPREMVEDNKTLFKEILDGFLARYAFDLPVLDTQAAIPQQP